jgi:phosphoadenosine phosphosulfate reductase
MTNTTQSIEIPSLEMLNDQFASLDLVNRIRALYDYFDKEEVLVTTSFGNNSAVLLRLVSEVQPEQKVHFINTGFHFPETLKYRDQLVRLLNLNLAEVSPSAQMYELTHQRRFWEKYPDTCCYLNKVVPLEPLKERHKVWMSGLTGFQTGHRQKLQIFEPPLFGEKINRFNPLVDRTEAQIRQFRQSQNLPPHPLEVRGYGSVGCWPCTACAPGRDGRWKDKAKTECGLHTNLHNTEFS